MSDLIVRLSFEGLNTRERKELEVHLADCPVCRVRHKAMSLAVDMVRETRPASS